MTRTMRITALLTLWTALAAFAGVALAQPAGSAAPEAAAGASGVVATLGPGMKGTFWLTVASFTCWYIALVVSRVQSTHAERELRELRERGLDLGVLQ